jgi:hypothetical protein
MTLLPDHPKKNRSTVSANAVAEIRRVAAAMIAGKTPEPGSCGSWSSFHCDFIRNNSLSPWFYSKLRQSPDCGLNPEIMAELEQSYRESVFHALRRQASLVEILKAFNSRGIPVAALKGVYLGAEVYKAPALRPMADIDLLVKETQFDEARLELNSLGYTTTSGADWESEIFGLPATCVKSEPFVQYVDLHRRIRAMDYYVFESRALWADAIRREIFDREIFYLSPEMNFIHMAVHTLNHRDLLRDWLDLALFSRTVALDWNKLMELAKVLGALRPLYWVFEGLERNWQVRPPEWVISELAAYSPSRLEDKVISGKMSYLWRLVARLKSLHGWRERFRYLSWKLIPISGKQGGAGLKYKKLDLKSRLKLFYHFWRS